MQLPSNEVGISDIIQHRECPQRFGYGMRRHTELPERFALYPGEKDDPPDSESYATAYGSCAHDAIQVLEEDPGLSNADAIDRVWADYAHWLEPDDLNRLNDDLDTYRTRTALGWRLVGAELEMRVPLYTREDGTVMYFRGRIDVLYQHMQNPALFMSRDYKSGRMPKKEEDVHSDLQQWSYNWLIHEYFPECQDLTQLYDQLRYGQTPTRKSAAQRRTIHAWLVRQVKAILGDQHLKPKQNDWCPYCPLLMDCRVTHLSADYWKNRLAALAPEKKVGRKIVVELTEEHAGFEVYTELLPSIKKSLAMMERFVEAVESALKEMPAHEREQYGYQLGNPRRVDTWGASELRAAHSILGDDFYQVTGISKAGLERFFGKLPKDPDPSDPHAAVLALAFKKEGAAPVKRVR